MDKKQILTQLMEKGFMASPEVVAGLADSPGMPNALEANFIIENGILVRKKQLSVEVTQAETVDGVQIADVVRRFRDRHAKLRSIIQERMQDSISINKLKTVFAQSAIIGTVAEHNAKGFVVEDNTGFIEVVSKERPELGCVVGLRGMVKEGRFFASAMQYPDIPFRRKLAKISGVTLSISAGRPASANISLSFAPDVGASHVITNPASVRVTKEQDTLSIVAFLPAAAPTVETTKELLRQRHLAPRAIAGGKVDNLALVDVPDIFWLAGDANIKEIYKGVVIIICRRDSASVVNLENLDVEFV
ncbi:MAG: hypothetical protein HY519_01245 [Candidatus Aenigmarchaeota archaeon]|nr:hypothetical protein [Candidatus Aenigmarchaeota archaeon]